MGKEGLNTGSISKKEVIRYYLLFFAIACSISWITYYIQERLSPSGALSVLMDRLTKFGPSMAGLIMIGWLYGKTGYQALLKSLLKLRVHWKWYLFSLAPLLILGITVFTLSKDAQVDPDQSWWRLLLFNANSGLIVYFLTRGGLGEELGWRGFAIPLLKSHFSLFKISFIIGLPWALWHLPALINSNLIGILLYTLYVLALSFLFTFLFEKTKRSLFFVILFHSTLNASDAFWESLLINEDPTGNWKIPLYAVLVIAAIFVAVHFYRNRNHVTLQKENSRTQPR